MSAIYQYKKNKKKKLEAGLQWEPSQGMGPGKGGCLDTKDTTHSWLLSMQISPGSKVRLCFVLAQPINN